MGRGICAAATTVPGIQLLGKVTDPSGIPVPRATVTVGADSAVTAPDGWFDMLATPGPLHGRQAGVGRDGVGLGRLQCVHPGGDRAPYAFAP